MRLGGQVEKERLKKAKASRRECERLGSHFFVSAFIEGQSFWVLFVEEERSVKRVKRELEKGICSFKCGVCRETKEEKESSMVQPESLLFGCVLSFSH